MTDFWERLLPERYDSGEFPGESLPGEMIRRATWKIVPAPVLRGFWERVLLGRQGFWCFLLGVNNSGTTLLHKLLGRHSAIRSLPAEGQFVTRGLGDDKLAGVPRLWTARPELFRWTDEHDGEAAVRAMHDWGFQFVRQRGTVLLEKSPPNTLRARWLQAHFSRSRFIAMFRHPCAVAEGVRRRHGYDLRTGAEHWARANRILLDDLQSIDQWTAVRYEELCNDPVGTLNRLAGFLGLAEDFRTGDVDNVQVHSLDESVTTVENFNPKSFARLSSREMRTIGSEVGDVAEQLGYDVPPIA